MYRGFYGYGDGYGMFGFPWLQLILSVAFIVLVIAGIVVLVRLARRQGSGGSIGDVVPREADLSAAIGILAERFARGEIDAETYRAMKAELEKR